MRQTDEMGEEWGPMRKKVNWRGSYTVSCFSSIIQLVCTSAIYSPWNLQNGSTVL